MPEYDNNLVERVKSIEEKLNSVLERNQKVELEKAWETSFARKFTIVALTYLLTSIVFYSIGIEEYLINAIIPTLGYFLSTQSIPVLKKYWIKNIDKKHKNYK